jgi:hypothetical protein
LHDVVTSRDESWDLNLKVRNVLPARATRVGRGEDFCLCVSVSHASLVKPINRTHTLFIVGYILGPK